MFTVSLAIALITCISWIRGAKFASVIARTPVTMVKHSNPLADIEVFTISQYTFYLNVSYQNAVRNAGKRIGSEVAANFEASPLGWATHLHKNILQHNKTEALYFCGVQQSRRTIRYEFADGTPLTEEQIQTVRKFKPAYQSVGQSQGLPDDKEVKSRMIKFENIISFKCGKHIWSRE